MREMEARARRRGGARRRGIGRGVAVRRLARRAIRAVRRAPGIAERRHRRARRLDPPGGGETRAEATPRPRVPHPQAGASARRAARGSAPRVRGRGGSASTRRRDSARRRRRRGRVRHAHDRVPGAAAREPPKRVRATRRARRRSARRRGRRRRGACEEGEATVRPQRVRDAPVALGERASASQARRPRGSHRGDAAARRVRREPPRERRRRRAKRKRESRHRRRRRRGGPAVPAAGRLPPRFVRAARGESRAHRRKPHARALDADDRRADRVASRVRVRARARRRARGGRAVRVGDARSAKRARGGGGGRRRDSGGHAEKPFGERAARFCGRRRGWPRSRRLADRGVGPRRRAPRARPRRPSPRPVPGSRDRQLRGVARVAFLTRARRGAQTRARGS